MTCGICVDTRSFKLPAQDGSRPPRALIALGITAAGGKLRSITTGAVLGQFSSFRPSVRLGLKLFFPSSFPLSPLRPARPPVEHRRKLAYSNLDGASGRPRHAVAGHHSGHGQPTYRTSSTAIGGAPGVSDVPGFPAIYFNSALLLLLSTPRPGRILSITTLFVSGPRYVHRGDPGMLIRAVGGRRCGIIPGT